MSNLKSNKQYNINNTLLVTLGNNNDIKKCLRSKINDQNDTLEFIDGPSFRNNSKKSVHRRKNKKYQLFKTNKKNVKKILESCNVDINKELLDCLSIEYGVNKTIDNTMSLEQCMGSILDKKINVNELNNTLSEKEYIFQINKNSSIENLDKISEKLHSIGYLDDKFELIKSLIDTFLNFLDSFIQQNPQVKIIIPNHTEKNSKYGHTLGYECLEHNDICWNNSRTNGELASSLIMKYLNLHLIKGNEQHNIVDNTVVVDLVNNKWDGKKYGVGDDDCVFLWSANVKNYSNWNGNPLRYKSKNENQTVYVDFSKDELNIMDDSVKGLNKLNSKTIPVILSPIYFSENNQNIQDKLNDFYQNNYLTIDNNNNANKWAAAASMFNNLNVVNDNDCTKLGTKKLCNEAPGCKMKYKYKNKDWTSKTKKSKYGAVVGRRCFKKDRKINNVSSLPNNNYLSNSLVIKVKNGNKSKKKISK